MREVRRLRQEKGWNQTELAFYAGLAPSVISEIETGKRNPSAGTLHKLAEALDVDVPDLFERTQDLKVQAPLPPEDAWERGANREGGDQERSIALAEKIQQQLDGQLKTLRDRRGKARSDEDLHEAAKDFHHWWLHAFDLLSEFLRQFPEARGPRLEEVVNRASQAVRNEFPRGAVDPRALPDMKEVTREWQEQPVHVHQDTNDVQE